MTVIIVESGPQRGRHVVLDPEQPIFIGSDTECELQLTSDGIADRQIVVKRLKSGGFGAKSLTGEFELNGEALAVSRLSEGDRIRIAGVELLVSAEAPPRAQAPDPTPAKSPAPPPSPSKKPRSDGHLRNGDEIGGFRILDILGKGGQGIVYRAEQISLNREVALKVLKHSLTADPVFVARFQAEARAAARLHHPNVVQVFDVGHEGDTWFYAMELMGQGSLEQLLKQRGKLHSEEVIPLLEDAARAFEYAEQLRIVHRDVKPDNLMLDQHGHIKLVDLGLALTEEDSDGGKAVGSPAFMSPEQALRRPVDHRSDIYSLGCTAYRLLAGRNPFRRKTVKEILIAHCKEEAEPIQGFAPGASPELINIVSTMMEKDPEDRFQSASELREALEGLTANKGPNRLVLFAGAGVLLLIAVGAVVWAATRPATETRIVNVGELSEKERQQAAEKRRQLEAKNALLEVRASTQVGIARAEAFEACAAKYPDTEAGSEAKDAAAEIRTKIAESKRLATEQSQAVTEAATALTTAFRQALDSGNLAAASAALEPNTSLAEFVLEAEEYKVTRDQLAGELQTTADAEIAKRQGPVRAALEARDAAALRRALIGFRAVIDGEAKLPESVVPAERVAELAAFADAARQRVDEIEAEQANTNQATAWEGYSRVTTSDVGPLRQLLVLQPIAAIDAFQPIVDEFPGTLAARRALALRPAFEAAEAYLKSLEAALSDGQRFPLPHQSDEAGLRLAGLERTPDGTAALLVEGLDADGQDPERIEAGQFGRNPARWFPELEQDRTGRAALVGLTALAHHIRAAREYMATLQPTDDSSGVGEHTFDLWPDDLIRSAAVLADRGADGGDIETWRSLAAEELTAARWLIQGMRALAGSRNQSAAKLFVRVQHEYPNSLVARAL